MPPPLSIIIPVLDAMPRLAECLSALTEDMGGGLAREVIVVDGGSDDASADLALDFGCNVVRLGPEGRGRARQMQAGAAAARGGWLMFLHADTVLEPGWTTALAAAMAESKDKAWHFTLAFDSQAPQARIVSALANLRADWFGLPYGDQGLMLSRKAYDALGGFRDMPFMEDVDLVVRIGRRRLRRLAIRARTSAGKHAAGGWFRVSLRNIWLVAAWFAGGDPARLKARYR